MPTIDRDGVEIHYEVHGSGPALLLTHGYSSTSAMWKGQVGALSKHHKLVLWDMRGHGQSDYPGDPAAYSEALTVAVPHLVLWGEADAALRPSCIEGLDDYAPRLAIKKIPDAGHWILHEKPDEVAEAIREFCG